MEFDTTTAEFILEDDEPQLLGYAPGTARLPEDALSELCDRVSTVQDNIDAIDITMFPGGSNRQAALELQQRKNAKLDAIRRCLRDRLEVIGR